MSTEPQDTEPRQLTLLQTTLNQLVGAFSLLHSDQRIDRITRTLARHVVTTLHCVQALDVRIIKLASNAENSGDPVDVARSEFKEVQARCQKLEEQLVLIVDTLSAVIANRTQAVATTVTPENAAVSTEGPAGEATETSASTVEVPPGTSEASAAKAPAPVASTGDADALIAQIKQEAAESLRRRSAEAKARADKKKKPLAGGAS